MGALNLTAQSVRVFCSKEKNERVSSFILQELGTSVNVKRTKVSGAHRMVFVQLFKLHRHIIYCCAVLLTTCPRQLDEIFPCPKHLIPVIQSFTCYCLWSNVFTTLFLSVWSLLYSIQFCKVTSDILVSF